MPTDSQQTSDSPSCHIFGIRHHGPGSARSLRRALADLRPDMLLVEGAPDAQEVLPLLAHAEMRPPVALLLYAADRPQQAGFYPFALFSPEWQAIQYALSHSVPVQLMDLAQAHLMALSRQEMPAEASEPQTDAHPATEHTPPPAAPSPDPQSPDPDPYDDPLRWLAEASGYSDSERWWDHMVEQRRDSVDLFAAILEAMTALREELPPSNDPREPLREAAMRQAIRKAQRAGYQRIAVVCGAWHAPALATMPPASHDTALLKGLPKVKVRATWVPWSYRRMTFASGYGAGIESPGWYHHLWSTEDHVVIRWLSKVARLLREEDLQASSAHVIEAVRLAETLAALRDRPLPGLPELNEAVQTVMCFGSNAPLQLIAEKLTVGDVMGTVPPETPMVPLQQDLQQQQKRLRLPPRDAAETRDLDLRKPTDLERSHLLHRLTLLGIPWGERQPVSGKSGTFHEVWRLQWQPEFAVRLIEASIWGTTIEEAAQSYTRHAAERAPDLPMLTRLVDQALLASLSGVITYLMTCLQMKAALTSDVGHLMEALPPLARVLRYGNVRKTDVSVVGQVVDGLVVRISVGLPTACASLNDEAAAAMVERLVAVHQSMMLLNTEHLLVSWYHVLQVLVDQSNVHGMLVGKCCRLLLDSRVLGQEEIARRMGLACSSANEPSQVAAWVEGFLQGSGLLLLHDDKLWQLLDQWVTTLPAEAFTAVLPLLRRTFATFPAPERRQMGERVRGRSASRRQTEKDEAIDSELAEAVVATVRMFLGGRP